MWAASPRRLDPAANAFFGLLPQTLRTQLDPVLDMVTLTAGRQLYAPGALVHHLMMPLTCVLGIVNVSDDGASTLLALVGAEGLVGLPAFMSERFVTASVLVCTPGVAARVPAASLQHAFMTDPAVRRLVLLYMQAFVAEIVESAHCGRHHTTLQQLSTLILRAQDKQGGGDLLLTHERMGGLLGVRRETVSHAAHALNVRGLVEYRRGHVHVLDRVGLERTACSCYSKVGRLYAQLYLSERAHAPAANTPTIGTAVHL